MFYWLKETTIREFLCEIACTSKNYFKRLFSKYQTIFNLFKYHLECRIDIAFIWDIPELFIWYIDKIIHEKVVLVSQDFLDGRNIEMQYIPEIYQIEMRTNPRLFQNTKNPLTECGKMVTRTESFWSIFM